MNATYYLILIEVHLRNTTFFKGQRLTLEAMGPYAFTLLHYGVAVRQAAVIKHSKAA